MNKENVKTSIQKNQKTTQVTALQQSKNNFKALLDRMGPQIATALPEHFGKDRMLRVILTSVNKTPKLLNCTQETLLGSIMVCAQLGLEPDDVMGHAYLLPYGNKCQLIVGYKGMIDLARRSGNIQSIYAGIVYENDIFVDQYGTEEKFEHQPYYMNGFDEPGKERFVYAYAHLKDGGFQRIVLTEADINKAKKASQAADTQYSPWKTWPEEMKKKTAIKRLCKFLPMSVQLAKAVQIDNKVEAGEKVNFDINNPDGEILDLTPQIPEDTSQEAEVVDEKESSKDHIERLKREALIDWSDPQSPIDYAKGLNSKQLGKFIEDFDDKLDLIPQEAKSEIEIMFLKKQDEEK